jgi:hypothetical protein
MICGAYGEKKEDALKSTGTLGIPFPSIPFYKDGR